MICTIYLRIYIRKYFKLQCDIWVATNIKILKHRGLVVSSHPRSEGCRIPVISSTTHLASSTRILTTQDPMNEVCIYQPQIPHPMGFCENVPENTLQLCPGRISLARILHVVLVQQVVQRPEEGWHEVRWLRYTNSDDLRLKSIPPLVSNNGG